MIKQHSKMYKAGKKWVVAIISATTISILGASAVHAATENPTTVPAVTTTQVAAANQTTIQPNSNANSAAQVNAGHLDGVAGDGQGNLVVTGWHASNEYQPGTKQFIIVLDANNNHELYRSQAQVVKRPDVQAAYPQAAIAEDGGFQATIPAQRLNSTNSYQVLSRFTTLNNGEPANGSSDYYFPVITSKAGCLDTFQVSGNKINVAGWHADDQAVNEPTHSIILYDRTKNREVARQQVANLTSKDVAQAGILMANAGRSRFTANFDLTPALVGDQLVIVSRYSTPNGANQAGQYSDYWFNDRPLTISDKQAACLDQFTVDRANHQIIASGWHAADASVFMPNHYLILFDQTKNQEVDRQKAATISSQDVAQNGFGSIANANRSRFNARFNIKDSMLGDQLVLVSRYSDDPTSGEGHHADYWFNNTVNLNQKAAWLDKLSWDAGKVDIAGWHADDNAVAYPYHFLILWDVDKNCEILRTQVNNVASPDIAHVHGDMLNADHARFSTQLTLPIQDSSDFIKVISRYSNSSNGEGAYSQVWIPNTALNIPAYDGKFIYDAQGNGHLAPTDTPEHVAALIAQCVRTFNPHSDLQRVRLAAQYVSGFSDYARYTMSGPYYSKPIGVFIKHEYSCAGSTRALGLVLNYLGYQYRHVNENLYTHQWCQLWMDGQIGWADGQVGEAGYGQHPIEG